MERSTVSVFRAVKDTHDESHEAPFTTCEEGVCGKLRYDEVSAIQEASRDNWGHNA